MDGMLSCRSLSASSTHPELALEPVAGLSTPATTPTTQNMNTSTTIDLIGVLGIFDVEVTPAC